MLVLLLCGSCYRGTEMRRLILQRTETGDHGTFGHIDLGGHRFLSGELPDRGNANNTSCIPAGVYQARLTFSPRFKRKLYLIDPVEGRSGIRIHSANFMGDKSKGLLCHLNGCIALGYKRSMVNGQIGIFQSLAAVRDFEDAMSHEEFELEIRQ